MPSNWVVRLSKEERILLEDKIVRLRKEEDLTQKILAARFDVSFKLHTPYMEKTWPHCEESKVIHYVSLYLFNM
jgi:uncharacterized protein VirK/YbjX